MEWHIEEREYREKGNISKKAVLYDTVDVSNLNKNKASLRIGDYTHIRGEIFLYHHGTIEIGDYCYIGEGTRIWAGEKIHIGNRVLISHNCNIVDNNSHPLSAEERHLHYKTIINTGHPDIDLESNPVTIYDDAWINEGVMILKGVTIGEGAIVGAGSVVTKDIPAWSMAAGNPAQVKKYLK